MFEILYTDWNWKPIFTQNERLWTWTAPSPRQLQHCIHVMPEIAKIPLQIIDFFSSRYVVISSQNRSLEFKNKKEHLTK